MQYFVLDPQGNKYGPADLGTLSSWAAEGRVVPNTVLEDAATGRRMAASVVLEFPGLGPPKPSHGAGYVPPSPNSPYAGPGPSSPYQAPQQPYQQPNWAQPPGPASYPRTMGDDGSNDMTMAWVFGALALAACMPLSIVGLIYANKAKEKGHPSAQGAIILNIVAMVLGLCGVGFFIVSLASGF